MFRFMKESANWLLTVGKIDQAEAVLKHIAKFNGKQVPESVWLGFQVFKLRKITIFAINPLFPFLH